MKITEALKKWLVANCSVKQDATDDEFRKAAGDAMVKGTLTAEEYIRLTAEPDKEKKVSEIDQRFGALADGIAALTKAVVAMQAPPAEKKDDDPPKPDDQKGAGTDGKGRAKPDDDEPTKTAKLIAELGGTPTDTEPGTEKAFQVRLKSAVERYDDTKTALHYGEKTALGRPHALAGQRVMDFDDHGRALDTISERDMACIGAWAKFQCQRYRIGGSKTLAFQMMTEHDRDLLQYALHNMEWSGGYGDREGTLCLSSVKLTPSERKDLIDDPTSGGLEAAPIVFDAAVIQTPLLNGELFPRVNRVTLARGRRVEGVSTGTVTGAWGGIDATAITLFTTTTYVQAFDTTVFRWQGAFRIGLDFLSDSPVDFAQHVTQQYGERLLEDLDDVIAVGNGTTQPQGVMNSGATAVAFGGATTIGAYETMRFGVAKAEHRATVKASAVFCGTETSYQRAVSIPVAAADARRIYNAIGPVPYDDYVFMNRPYAINESLANTQIFYAILARYRMYVRRGLTIRTSTEGDTLIRNNEMLIAVTARYGGRMERAAAASLTTTAAA